MPHFIYKHRLVLIALILYFPFIFFGYGSDNDTFGVLGTVKNFIETQSYIPSRHPGYIVHEIATLLLSSIGGSILSNAGTMVMALLFIACFQKICRHFSVPNTNYLSIILIVHPLIYINSTETIDYLWALGLIFSGFVLLLNRNYAFAGLVLGLAVGARLSSFIAVGGILAYALFFKEESEYTNNRRKVFTSIMVAGLIAVACYLPSLNNAQWTLSFLKPHMPDNNAWTFTSRVGKFIYKNIYFWGLPGSIALACIFYLVFRNRKNYLNRNLLGLPLLSLSIIIGYELLFLKFPVQIEYLLPILPFSLFLIGIGLKNNRRIIVVLIILIASLNLVNFNIAKPDLPGEATTARMGFWIEQGLFLEDLKARIRFRNCTSMECWSEQFNQGHK